jgi:prephenate dehydratase
MFNNITKIFFLGPYGTYTQAATQKLMEQFEIKCAIEPVSTIKKVLEQVCKNNNSLAVVPIENSVEGIVRETIDGLLTMPDDFHILAQTVIPIGHCLISRGKMEDIKSIISHPQALSQCQNFIANNFGKDIVQIQHQTPR